MTNVKPGLKENPKEALEQYLGFLHNESKQARKQALEKINYEIFENPLNSDCDLTIIFPEIYPYILKAFHDPSEASREISGMIISNFIERLPLNDYYLTYIIPVIVRRIGCVEIIESSEEIRLLLIELVHKIIEKYKSTHLLAPFLNDFTSILTKSSTDPFPKVKLVACECIILLSNILQRDFHFQAESYVKPVLKNFDHQHFRVRVAAVKAIGAIVLAGNARCFELALTPMAEKVFDENTQVRMQVTLEVGNWMLNYRDRYSFWHRLIPLLLTSLSDVMADVRETATKLWSDVGLQYMEENEEDLKKKLDFLKDVPSHYPDVKRPNFGCRVLVQKNFGKIVPAIEREINGWREDPRLRVSQLLCWLLLCAEEGSTQNLDTIVNILKQGAKDVDPRVVLEIKRASELFGYFIDPESWWQFFHGDLGSWNVLMVLANILKGSKPDEIKGKIMHELCYELALPSKCRVWKTKNQAALLHVTEALMDLCKGECAPEAEQLFVVNFTVYSMPTDDEKQFMALSNLDKLRYLERCGPQLADLYERHIGRVLADITSEDIVWNNITAGRFLFESVLLHAGRGIGKHLDLIAPLLEDCLATQESEPEVKLKVFTALSTVLLKRRENFGQVEMDKLEAFLQVVINDVIIPNLVWSPGRTAEAIRTAAVACLCSALQDDSQDLMLSVKETVEGAAVEKTDNGVDLFPTKESLEPFIEEIIPLLVGLADDNSELTRQHTMRAIRCLANVAAKRACFTAEMLHKLYFVVLKRLDDCSGRVRSFAVQTVRDLFTHRPRPYDTVVYGAHVDAVYSAMLIHLDDDDEGFRKEMLDALVSLCDIDPALLLKKVKSNIHLYRNKAAYERLSSHIEKMLN